MVTAVLPNPEVELTKQKVEAVLHEILQSVRDAAQRRGDPVDGVSVELYLSTEHLKGAVGPFAQADWWPKGHSFSADNDINVVNKATHVETLSDFRLPEQVTPVLSRLTESTRRDIFTALIRAEDRANREAKAK